MGVRRVVVAERDFVARRMRGSRTRRRGSLWHGELSTNITSLHERRPANSTTSDTGCSACPVNSWEASVSLALRRYGHRHWQRN